MKTKGWAFLITAGVQVLLMFGCYFCAKHSAAADEKMEKDEIEKHTRMY